MPKKTEYVVRIVVTRPVPAFAPSLKEIDKAGSFLECLRYAGVISLHHDDEAKLCFDILCPKGYESKPWAEMNAARMQSFGYNAVVAPLGSILVISGD